VELVTNFVLFETRDGKTVKKLPRYQQWRAVRKTVQRLTSATPLGGVIWHTQGSGKSLTMALLGNQLETPFGAIPFYLLVGMNAAPLLSREQTVLEDSPVTQLLPATRW